MIVALTSKGGRRWRRVKRKEETECERKKEASVSMMVWFPRFGTPYSVSYTVVRPVLCYGQVKTGYLVLYLLTCTVHTLAFCYRTTYNTTRELQAKFANGPQMAAATATFRPIEPSGHCRRFLAIFFLCFAVQALFFFFSSTRPARLAHGLFGKGAEFDLLRGLEPHVSRRELARFGLEVELGPWRRDKRE